MNKIDKLRETGLNLYHINWDFGPGKRVKNLTKGLRSLGIEPLINEPLANKVAGILQPHEIWSGPELNHFVVGPNIHDYPSNADSKIVEKAKRTGVMLVANAQKLKSWQDVGVPRHRLGVWPGGVDTDEFAPVSVEPTTDCLIYFKYRAPAELVKVISLLKTYNQTYMLIEYGGYDEDWFKLVMSKCRYAFVLDGWETFGFATMEILSSGLPIMSWSVDRDKECFADSVPQWHPMCGEKAYCWETVEKLFSIFIQRVCKGVYTPRAWIEGGFSLKHMAEQYLDFISRVYED